MKNLIQQHLKSIKHVYPCIQLYFTADKISLTINNELILKTLFFFKFHYLHQFKVLTCLSGVDYPENRCRFRVIFELLSVRYNSRLQLKIFNSELTPLDSSIKIFSNSEWFEAEIWDLFGIFFNNHYNLIRLLTDYGFEGFPGRKNFPVIGYVESRYSEIKKAVIREVLELNQLYRDFKFLSVWEKSSIF